VSARDIAYHEMMGLLGVGDLHPAGHVSTEFLLGELERTHPESVLEVGAGVGWTTDRMLKRGWKVTPVEPSAVLARALTKRLRIPVAVGTFEDFDGAGAPFDAVIGEGAFYRLAPQPTVAKLARLLRPGGLFAVVDMTWTPSANPDVVAFIHDQTKDLFGIPMAPREVVTASTWADALRAGGFEEIVTKTIDPAAFDAAPGAQRARTAAGLLRRPYLLPLFLRYGAYNRIRWTPAGWAECWMAVWKRV
jgi:SAM-dependent methyltransferase